MRKILILSAFAMTSLSLAACSSPDVPHQADYDAADGVTAASAPVAASAPADHTLRDGLIGGALGYMAGRASQPRPQVHYTTHVYHPSYTRPTYQPAYRPPYRPFNSGRSTTIIRTYRR